jgi:hypothetical protein
VRRTGRGRRYTYYPASEDRHKTVVSYLRQPLRVRLVSTRCRREILAPCGGQCQNIFAWAGASQSMLATVPCCDRPTSCGSQHIHHCPSFVAVVMAMLVPDKSTVILPSSPAVIRTELSTTGLIALTSGQHSQYCGNALRPFANLLRALQCFTTNCSGIGRGF